MTSTTDFTTLGRLGTSHGRPAATRRLRGRLPARPPSRRRPPSRIGRLTVPQLVAAVVGVSLVLLWAVGALVGAQTQVLPGVTVATPSVDPQLEASLMAGGTQSVATGAMRLMPGGGAATGSVTAPPAFAAVEDVALHLPSAMGEDVVFTEADAAAALPLGPVGAMVDNGNPEGYRQTRTTIGPAYSVAPPLSGVRPATGMAVVLAAAGTPVTAPVQGVVEEVASYTTADGSTDWAISIAPQGRTDLLVVLRHVDAPAVVAGDRVTVGLTPVGTVRPGMVLDATTNPLALPGVLLHVQPAVQAGMPSDAAADAAAGTAGDGS